VISSGNLSHRSALAVSILNLCWSRYTFISMGRSWFSQTRIRHFLRQLKKSRGRCGHDRMVVPLSTIVAVRFIGGENHQPVASHWQTFYNHIMLYRVHLTMKGFELITLVVIDNDCIDSCKTYYHTIMTTTAPAFFWAVEGNALSEFEKIRIYPYL
jgi:hypothetical protein